MDKMQELRARINQINQTRGAINTIASHLRGQLEKYVGQKIYKVDGSETKLFKYELIKPELTDGVISYVRLTHAHDNVRLEISCYFEGRFDYQESILVGLLMRDKKSNPTGFLREVLGEEEDKELLDVEVQISRINSYLERVEGVRNAYKVIDYNAFEAARSMYLVNHVIT